MSKLTADALTTQAQRRQIVRAYRQVRFAQERLGNPEAADACLEAACEALEEALKLTKQEGNR